MPGQDRKKKWTWCLHLSESGVLGESKENKSTGAFVEDGNSGRNLPDHRRGDDIVGTKSESCIVYAFDRCKSRKSTERFLTEKAIQEGVAYFVIIAEDASGNTQKKFMDKCKYYEIPYTIAFDSTTLGRQIGKQERTVLAVTDAGLAKQISDKLD